jgi:hypothetical protein
LGYYSLKDYLLIFGIMIWLMQLKEIVDDMQVVNVWVVRVMFEKAENSMIPS